MIFVRGDPKPAEGNLILFIHFFSPMLNKQAPKAAFYVVIL